MRAAAGLLRALEAETDASRGRQVHRGCSAPWKRRLVEEAETLAHDGLSEVSPRTLAAPG